MSNPTITKDGVTFTFQDGNCDRVTIQKQGTLDENPIPASDSDGTFVIDINGVTKTITLAGFLTEAATSRTSTGSVLTIEDQITWLLTLVDGAQMGYTFNSTYQTNKTVYCRRASFDENAGQAALVPFTLEFVEGS
jgi:hypothetical protein